MAVVTATVIPNLYKVENQSAHRKKHVDPVRYVHNASSLIHRAVAMEDSELRNE